MSSENTSASDYKSEFKSIANKLKKLRAGLVDDVHRLANVYPDAIIANKDQTGLKAKLLSDKDTVDGLMTDSLIGYLDKIEAHIREINKNKQYKLFK